jgi:hypothetical protein
MLHSTRTVSALLLALCLLIGLIVLEAFALRPAAQADSAPQIVMAVPDMYVYYPTQRQIFQYHLPPGNREHRCAAVLVLPAMPGAPVIEGGCR